MSARCWLWEMFRRVPDPRGRRGRRYELQALLTLSSVAMLSGARSLFAIAQFGRDYGLELAQVPQLKDFLVFFEGLGGGFRGESASGGFAVLNESRMAM